MGSGHFTTSAYDSLRSTKSYDTKSQAQIFTNTNTHKDMDPRGVVFRESRDSDDHPESLAVMVYLDVTGSMGRIPERLVREKLGPLMTTMISHKIEHSHVFFGAIGDHLTDRSPLQVGQFEAETGKLDHWLSSIYLEGHGGGQYRESYLLAWYFAARHTSIDCFEKRNQKGFLFTIGDEATWEELSPEALEGITGNKVEETLTAKQLLAEAQRMYHVFHIHVKDGSYGTDARIIDPWKALLGERLLILDDSNDVAELIASTVAVVHGVDLKTVTAGFNAHTAASVTNALVHVSNSLQKNDSTTGIQKL